MNMYLLLVIAILIGEYLLTLIVEILNLRRAKGVLPEEFRGFYDAERYKQAQHYLRGTTQYSLLKKTFFTFIIIAFILSGGFNLVDLFARGFNQGAVFSGLVFAAVLLLAVQLLNIPFSAYRTFVLEQRFGFNRTTLKTFILDILKGLALGVVIGGAGLALVLWLFQQAAKTAWIYCWLAVTIFQLFLAFIAPLVILPLFNKFTPLDKGELKEAIENYAALQNFKLNGIFKLDASRRSTKSNAYFTGFGKYRRIALFDTLIARHSVEELVSILAHEIGHYKKRHIIKGLVVSAASGAIMFFILSLFINHQGLFAAFKMENTSIYASIFFFGFLYAPLKMIFSVLQNFLSRRYEFAADAYSLATYKKPGDFIVALKKLSVDNLSNLTPHPLKVFLDYSHPPLLERIRAINKMN